MARKEASIVAFSDAGYPHRHCQKLKAIAQEGCLVGISFGEAHVSVFHLLSYFSRKQRQVSTSSFAAESIAAVSAYGLASMIQDSIKNLIDIFLLTTLVVDNGGPQKCIATERTPRDVLTLTELTKLQTAYEDGYLTKITWIPGTQNPADCLTKPFSGNTSAQMDDLIISGRKLLIDVNNELNRGNAQTEKL